MSKQNEEKEKLTEETEITVTFNLPQNVKDFLTSYSQLLKYESLEDFLKEDIQYYFSEEAVANRDDVYFSNDIVEEIMKRHDLVEKKKETTIK